MLQKKSFSIITFLISFSFLCLLINLIEISSLNAPSIFDSDYGRELNIEFDIYNNGTLVDTSTLPYTFKSSTKNKHIELVGTLYDDNLIDNTFISFRSSGYSVIIEIDNKEIYNYYNDNVQDYGGGYWHFARLPQNSRGKEIKIKLFCPTDNPFAQNLFQIYNGSKGYLITEDFKLKYASLFLGLMLISFGFVFLGIIFFLKNKFNNSILFSLSLLLICFGTWIFTQSGSKQILGITNPALPMIFSFFSMVSLPFFLWYYLITNYISFKKYKIIKYYAFFVLLLYIPITISNIYFIPYTKFLFTIGILILIYSLLLLIISIKIHNNNDKNILSFIIAISCIFISIIFEEIFLLLKINIKAIPVLHIGMALASIIFIYKTINNLIEKNIEDNEKKLLKKMAYIDIVTLTKNRNSYEKFIKENNNTINKVGIILADINCLKIINDKYGHKYGDLLIKQLSKKLKTSLPQNSLLFRIGGDEFVAIINSIEKNNFEKLAKKLYQEFSPSDKDYGMAIGSHFLIQEKDINLINAVEKADIMMYCNKIKQKPLLKNCVLEKDNFGK